MSYFLVLGKAGVGKSTFLMWLLYKLYSEAKTSKMSLPSIVVVGRDQNKLSLTMNGHTVWDGKNKPEYLFSDSHDIHTDNDALKLCLVVSSENEAKTGYKEFEKRVQDNGGRVKYLTSMTRKVLKNCFLEILFNF
jgi:GTPase SAR1 family protein